MHDPKKAAALASKAAKKVDKAGGGPLSEVIDYLKALIRLVAAFAKGDYRAVPWESIVMAVAAVLYFVSPVDLIPDPIPGLGFTDDAAVVAFVVAMIRDDLDEFMAWEKRQGKP